MGAVPSSLRVKGKPSAVPMVCRQSVLTALLRKGSSLVFLLRTGKGTSGLVERLMEGTLVGLQGRDTMMSTGLTLEGKRGPSLTTGRVMNFVLQFSTIFTKMESDFTTYRAITRSPSFVRLKEWPTTQNQNISHQPYICYR